MKKTLILVLIVMLLSMLVIAAEKKEEVKYNSDGYPVHSMEQPQPRVIEPGTFSTQEKPGRPPSDAIVLFDGRDTSAWMTKDGGSIPWKVKDGYMEIVPKSGVILTKRDFTSIQLHIEFATPVGNNDKGQKRGNSGVFLAGRHEVQVLDCYGNQTYPDGQTAAIYAHKAPLVNACRPQGKWQTYDIIFHAAKRKNGKTVHGPTITVLHNGVLVQDNVEMNYKKLRGPIKLQDHKNRVRYRNIWVRELD